MKSRLAQWLRRFLPAPFNVGWRERARVCCGALLGIAITGLLTPLLLPQAGSDLPLLIAPMGASAVLLFAVPASPLAQPWSIAGGNLLAALIGVTCALWVQPPLLAAALAVACTIGATFTLRCVHPPAGAVALTAVLGGPVIHNAGYAFAWGPVCINSLVLLSTGILWHRLTGHRYPHVVSTQATPRFGFSAADLDAVLKNHNEMLDISRDDLESLLQQAELRSYQRRFGILTCADIMSTRPLSVPADCSQEQAWTVLHRHQLKALPVTDAEQHIVGIITLADFVDGGPGETRFRPLRRALMRAVRRAGQPARVAEIMTTAVCSAALTKPIAELVPLFADGGHRHIPIVDEERRLVGIVTQSDLIMALYRQRLLEQNTTVLAKVS